MPRRSGVPAYRRLTENGRELAVVTLPDAATRRRRTYRLGPYGSDESRERYARLIAKWERAARRLPADRAVDSQRLTVTQLCWAWIRAVVDHYSRGERDGCESMVRVFRGLYGVQPAADIGPRALKDLRAAMIAGDQCADPPRAAWSRPYVNHQINRLRRMYKWAVSEELVPVATYQALCTVAPLRNT